MQFPSSLLSQVHLLSMLCQEQCKERYTRTVEQLVSAARQIQDEVVSMEVDILVGQSMAQLLEKSRPELDGSIKDLQLEATIAAGEDDYYYYNKTMRLPGTCPFQRGSPEVRNGVSFSDLSC